MTSGSLTAFEWTRAVPRTDVVLRMLLSGGSGAAAAGAGATQSLATPVTVGSQSAGSFDDATGHSAQSHLVYAANSKVWWLFTLTSAGDAQGGSNHIVKAFHSSGPDLTVATWIAAADSPGAASGSPNGSLAGGRSLGIAYVNNAPVDVVHADISMAFDGQDGRTSHIRAVVTGTTITWSTWDFFDEPAATWTEPRGNVVGADPTQYTWAYQYDEAGNRIRVTDPLGNYVQYAYDGANNPTQVTDQRGNATAMTYDTMNRLWKVTPPAAGGTGTLDTVYAYDADGNLASRTDPNSHTTTWVYDFDGLATQRTTAVGTWNLTYDSNGNSRSSLGTQRNPVGRRAKSSGTLPGRPSDRPPAARSAARAGRGDP